MRRRTWLLGSTGLAAAAAGVGWQQWHERRAAAAGSAEADATGLWEARFATPGGGELALATLRGAPLVLNFWATWCPPCVKEMPELDRFAREMAPRGVRVVGLAIDGPTPVREFLARTPVRYPIGLAGFGGTDLSRRLGNTRGALPFTAVFDRHGALVQRKLGETDFAELSRWVQAL